MLPNPWNNRFTGERARRPRFFFFFSFYIYQRSRDPCPTRLSRTWSTYQRVRWNTFRVAFAFFLGRPFLGMHLNLSSVINRFTDSVHRSFCFRLQLKVTWSIKIARNADKTALYEKYRKVIFSDDKNCQSVFLSTRRSACFYIGRLIRPPLSTVR